MVFYLSVPGLWTFVFGGHGSLILVLENLADGAMTWEEAPPSQETIAVNLTKTNPCGNSIYTFTVKDADDSVTFSLTQNPDGKFTMGDDRLYCTADTLKTNGYSSYNLTVTITDGKTTLTDTFTVTIIGLPTTTTQTNVAPTTQTSTASTTLTSTLSTIQATAASATPTSTLSTTTTVIPDVPIEFTSPNSTTHYICESDQADDEVVALAARQGYTSTGFIFSIESTQTKFTIKNNNTLVVARNNSFDAESAETSYNLNMKVVLASDSKKSATVNITIKVDDINDNYPEFTKPSYNFTISERSQGGEIIGSVSATDKDATPPNNVISFTINDTTKFQISNNGTITLANNISLDNENKSTYSFTVTATDGGTDDSALNSTVTVQVTIETAPKFADGPVKAVDIREDIGQQAYVWSLSASDRDSAPNANLEFDILSQLPASPTMFKLNGSNLTTADNMFDYENRTSYVVVVRAYDGKYDSTLSLNISVEDVNDNPPRFNSSSFTTSIVENFKIDGVVVSITARDDDVTPEFAKTSYSITAGNNKNEFTIDKDTGAIRFQAIPLQQSYTLTVKAEDKHTTWLSSETNVTIIVDGVPVHDLTKEDSLLGVKVAVPVVAAVVIISVVFVVLFIRRKRHNRLAYNFPSLNHLASNKGLPHGADNMALKAVYQNVQDERDNTYTQPQREGSGPREHPNAELSGRASASSNVFDAPDQELPGTNIAPKKLPSLLQAEEHECEYMKQI